MKYLIVANWKMNPKSLKEAKDLFSDIEGKMDPANETEVVICPPFTFLSEMPKGKVKLGAQNCSWEEEGAFTGEISLNMLKDVSCEYVIVGHSERRKYYSETDKDVNKKAKAVLEGGLKLILCVGETEEERKAGKTSEVLKTQLKAGLEGISDLSSVTIAYEPVWAIGTGNACSVDDAKEAGELIRSEVSGDIVLIYGGSAKKDNAEGYLKEAGFQGLLVGGASLKADEFAGIVEKAN